jgi:hypothetical protein
MSNNIVYANQKDRFTTLYFLSPEIRGLILDSIETRLTGEGISGRPLANALADALNSKLCDLEDAVSIQYLENEPLRFYVVNNLRSQQDKTSFDVYRFDTLDDAYNCYSQYCDKYTSALGVTISSGREIDIVHSRAGEPVLVTDYRKIDGFKDNPLVLQVVNHAIGKLGILREGNYELFNQWVEIPLNKGESANSYLENKRLLPEVPRHPISAINEAFCDGRGWVKADDLFKELSDYDPYVNPVHLKISCVNVNYIRTDTKEVGQMDLIPSQLGIMLERFKEREKKLPLDCVISAAEKKKDVQINGLPEKARDDREDK